MYLLDWMTPKKLESPINLLYDMWVADMQPPINNRNKDKIRKAVSCFVYNACYWVPQGLTNLDVVMSEKAYSQPLYYNANKVNRQVSYKYSKSLFLWLHEKGLAILTTGYVESWVVVDDCLTPSKRIKSTLQLSSELIGLLVPPDIKTPVNSPRSVLEVRDKNGDTISKRKGVDQKHLIEVLETFNVNIRDCVIEVDGITYWVQAKKVYNVSWERGGRTYLTGHTELLRKDKRGKIMINGEKTVTLDFKHLHPSILATLEGVKFEEGFDPYGVVMEGCDPDVLRKIAKVALLCMINADSLHQASCAISWEMYKKLPKLQEWKSNGLLPDPVPVKPLIIELVAHNKYAEKYFGKGYGLTLQNIDSKIIDHVMEYFNQKGISLIPLYDSITIQQQYQEEAIEVMKVGYQKVLGTLDNCKISVE